MAVSAAVILNIFPSLKMKGSHFAEPLKARKGILRTVVEPFLWIQWDARTRQRIPGLALGFCCLFSKEIFNFLLHSYSAFLPNRD